MLTYIIIFGIFFFVLWAYWFSGILAYAGVSPCKGNRENNPYWGWLYDNRMWVVPLALASCLPWLAIIGWLINHHFL